LYLVEGISKLSRQMKPQGVSHGIMSSSSASSSSFETSSKSSFSFCRTTSQYSSVRVFTSAYAHVSISDRPLS
jgi:hypothetical protein